MGGAPNRGRREFPGGPVVRTQCFHCRGPGSIPGQGTKIPKAVLQGQKNKNKNKTKQNKKQRQGQETSETQIAGRGDRTEGEIPDDRRVGARGECLMFPMKFTCLVGNSGKCCKRGWGDFKLSIEEKLLPSRASVSPSAQWRGGTSSGGLSGFCGASRDQIWGGVSKEGQLLSPLSSISIYAYYYYHYH